MMYRCKDFFKKVDRDLNEQCAVTKIKQRAAHYMMLVFITGAYGLLSACSSTPYSNQLLNSPVVDGKALQLDLTKPHNDISESLTQVQASNVPTSLPLRQELSDTPFFPQQRYQCGPAALATVLQHQGVPVTPDALVSEVYVPGVKGSYDFELSAATRRFKRIAYLLEPSLIDILIEVAAGNPVLVKQNLGLTWVPKWHFAVVVGYDMATKEVILRSGTVKRWRSSLRAFERTLQRADYWAMVVTNLHQAPATAKPERYLAAVQDVAKLHGDETVLPAYFYAKQRWPDIWLSDFLIANYALLKKQYLSAIQYFDLSLQKNKHEVLVLNNYAYALDGLGCREQALKSLHCGLSKSPQHVDLMDSLQDIKNRPESQLPAGCPSFTCEDD